MAQDAPVSVDVQDIQFKLHEKFTIFSEQSQELKSLVSLLAVSSSKGLLFAGNQHDKELKVIKLKDVIDCKGRTSDLPVRVVPLPGVPLAMACNCDGSLLAVNYIMNNTGFLNIYQVESFLTANISSLYNVPICPESNVFALQLLWNPMVANNIAIVLNNGSVTMFMLNPSGQYDIATLGKEHQVKSGCWSPKGKQIVFGFAEGKLQQFKPNLQPARAIPCPPGIYPGPFDCIAVHWLSTFQFAAVFLQRGPEMCPSLFIINAPKVGNPSYINYYDICYSAPGPRTQQVTFNHIAVWNMLLVSSANGVEVGILGTKEAGENPSWLQYTLLDEARIEMPLTEGKDETYPVGFVYDTSPMHHVKLGEQSLPCMPMIYVLSTHGHLLAFDFLNLAPTATNVCVPSQALSDASGQFRAVKETLKAATKQNAAGIAPQTQNKPAPVSQAPAGFGDSTFTLSSNMVTSTPAVKEKTTPLFGSLTTGTAKPAATGFGFGGTANTAVSTADAGIKPSGTQFSFASAATAAAPAPATSAPSTTIGFGNTGLTSSFGNLGSGFSAKPADKPPPQASAAAAAPINALKANEISKPLYTIPPTYKPPTVMQPIKPSGTQAASKVASLNTNEIDEVVNQMINIQIQAFDAELAHMKFLSTKLMDNLGNIEEVKGFTKQLNDLQEILEQANDHEFEQDVQNLRHCMNESYAMLAECRSKLDMYQNPDLSRLATTTLADPTNRRQLAKLQAYVATNQAQLSQLNNIIDAQWSQYQDILRRNTKNPMHIPCLDGVYQRMSKLKDLLARQRTKMNQIKAKLKQKGLSYKPPTDLDITTAAVGALTKNQNCTMESLADSILSISLSQVVAQSHAKLSEEKLNAIRNFTKQQQQITIIKPKRPDRVGLKSEVILETKLERDRKQKELARQKQQMPAPMQKAVTQAQPIKPIQQQQQQQPQPQLQQQQQQMQQLMQQQYNQQLQHFSSGMPQQLQQQQQPQTQTLLAKPTASKPTLPAAQSSNFMMPSSTMPSTLSFGSGSGGSFVKTSAASSTVASKVEAPSRPLATSSPFPGFGTGQTLSFGATKAPTVAPPIQKVESKENIPANTPISFSAKVIGGNDSNKSLTGKPPAAANESAPVNSPFAGFGSSKPAVLTDTASKENKKPDEAPKSFSFGGLTASLGSSSTTASSTPAFGGFGNVAKPSAVSTTTATTVSSSGGSIFSSNMFTSATPSFSAFSTANTATTGVGSFNAPAKPIGETSAAANAAAKAEEKKTAEPQKDTSATPLPTQSASGFSFGGFGQTSSAVVSSSTSSSSSTTKSTTAPPNVVVATPLGIPEPKTATAAEATPSSKASDPTDALFGSLNICKPDTKPSGDVPSSTGNIFGGFAASLSTSAKSTPGPFAFATGSGAGDGATSFISTPATTAAAKTATTPATASIASPFSSNIFGQVKPTVAGAATTSAPTIVATASNASSSAATTAASSSIFSFANASGGGGAGGGSLFGALSLSPASTSSAASTTGISTTAATSTPTVASIFGATPATSAAASTAAATSTTASIFGGASAAISAGGPSLFGSTAPSVSAAATPGASGSIFGGSTAAAASQPAATTNIFGGIPKPDQSVFGAAAPNTTASATGASGLFAAAAAETKSPGSAAATGGSIFGGNTGAVGFGSAAPAAATGGSIFGGGSTATSTSPFASSGGSIFGGAAAMNKPAEGGNVFGAPSQPTAASGASLFGKSAFGQTAAVPAQQGGSIFGAAATQSPTAGGFGASGGSIFGGGNTSFGAPAATSPGFGSFSQTSNTPAFGSPSGGFGAAAGAGAFSSPTQQSAFAKPVFGGPATFGSPPAFGAAPTFGGAPSFGSPKGFGSFAATSPTGFGAAATQPAAAAASKGNIFETLGATDSGLSFGNLAHSTQPPNQAKPAFGGSSFMNYRS